MTREELLKDEWVKENFGDACYPNYLEPNFEAGVEYGERKMIEKACECIIKLHNWPTQYEEYAKLQEEFIKEFRKAMEDDI